MLGKNPTKIKKIIYLSVTFGLMFVVTVFRYGVGNDYYSYMRISEQIWAADWGQIFSLDFEPLYAIVVKLLAYTPHEIMYGIFAVLILTPVAFSIYRYSDNVWISVCVYLCFTFFYTQLSFIRQSLAVSVLILAFGFMKKRRIVPVLILAVIAALFHYTAAIFIPLYLISLIRPTKKYLIIYGSVSVGALIVCLIMKAVGVNPLNLVSQVITAVTGKDYTGYVGSEWFETGFGPQYLVMPAAVMIFVLVSYFLGWKEKQDAPMLLQLTLFNTTIWSFITYAYIIERFSMFVFIFSVFTIPSVTEYFAEQAKAAKRRTAEVAQGKKIPGYSKKASDDKADNSFLITTITIISMFVYNCWSLVSNFHGINPYCVNIPAVQDIIDNTDGPEENLVALSQSTDLYNALIHLKNTDKPYVIVSTSDHYNGITKGVRRAMDYAGTKLNRNTQYEAKDPAYVEYNNRNGEVFTDEGAANLITYTSANGIEITNDGKKAVITDKNDKTMTLDDNRIAIIMADEDGNLIGGVMYDVTEFRRAAGSFAPR